MATVAPIIVEERRFTPGSMVAKLLPAMNAQKHALGIEATA
jgi:hypothetical protein